MPPPSSYRIKLLGKKIKWGRREGEREEGKGKEGEGKGRDGKETKKEMGKGKGK